MKKFFAVAGIFLLAALLLAGVCFGRLRVMRIPDSVEWISVRSGTTGREYRIDRETNPELFDAVCGAEYRLEKLALSGMGHTYSLDFYADGKVVREFVVKLGYSVYEFPYYRRSSVNLEALLNELFKEAEKETEIR